MYIQYIISHLKSYHIQWDIHIISYPISPIKHNLNALDSLMSLINFKNNLKLK